MRIFAGRRLRKHEKKNKDDKSYYVDNVTFEAVEAQFIRIYCTAGQTYDDGASIKDAASIWEIEVMAYVEDGTVSVPSNPAGGVNSVAIWVVVALAAAACIGMTVVSKKATK